MNSLSQLACSRNQPFHRACLPLGPLNTAQLPWSFFFRQTLPMLSIFGASLGKAGFYLRRRERLSAAWWSVFCMEA